MHVMGALVKNHGAQIWKCALLTKITTCGSQREKSFIKRCSFLAIDWHTVHCWITVWNNDTFNFARDGVFSYAEWLKDNL